jgi:hypothetical protein
MSQCFYNNNIINNNKLQMRKLIIIKMKGEEFVVTKFLHIIKIIQQIVIKDLLTNKLEND